MTRRLDHYASRSVFAVGLGVAAALTLLTVQRAYAAVAVANALVTTRVTAAGGLSTGITIPVTNTPVHIAATTNVPSALRGTASGAVTRHVNGDGADAVSSAFVNAYGTSPATLAVQSGAPGADLALLSPGTATSSNVLEVGPAVSQIRVNNLEGAATTTVITMIW